MDRIEAKKQHDISSIQTIASKYLYKNLDGAYSLKDTSTYSEVKSTILYQVPVDVAKKYGFKPGVVHQMDITINLAVYSGKLRVELVQISPKEETIGFRTYGLDVFDNVQQGLAKVLSGVAKSIRKRYQDYDILF